MAQISLTEVWYFLARIPKGIATFNLMINGIDIIIIGIEHLFGNRKVLEIKFLLS